MGDKIMGLLFPETLVLAAKVSLGRAEEDDSLPNSDISLGVPGTKTASVYLTV